MLQSSLELGVEHWWLKFQLDWLLELPSRLVKYDSRSDLVGHAGVSLRSISGFQTSFVGLLFALFSCHHELSSFVPPGSSSMMFLCWSQMTRH